MISPFAVTVYRPNYKEKEQFELNFSDKTGVKISVSDDFDVYNFDKPANVNDITGVTFNGAEYK